MAPIRGKQSRIANVDSRPSSESAGQRSSEASASGRRSPLAHAVFSRVPACWLPRNHCRRRGHAGPEVMQARSADRSNREAVCPDGAAGLRTLVSASAAPFRARTSRKRFMPRTCLVHAFGVDNSCLGTRLLAVRQSAQRLGLASAQMRSPLRGGSHKEKTMRAIRLIALVACVSWLSLACGDDDETTSGSGGGAGTTAGTGTTGGSGNPSTGTGTGTDTGTGASTGTGTGAGTGTGTGTGAGSNQ